MISFRVQVTTTYRRCVVRELGGKLATFEGTQMPLPVTNTKDPIKSLYKPNGARVAVAVEEKLNGPANSYSSVAVRVEIAACCEQDETAIRKLTSALHTEALRALGHYVTPSMELLLAHLEAHA